MATKTLETVTIQSFETNDRGWFEVETAEYSEPLVTKDAKVISAVKSLGAGQANVSVNVKTNGDFINRYLNDVQAANGEVLAAPEPSAEVSAVQASKRDERAETQERIARQWAFGRAVELHIASGGTAKDVLDTDKFQEISAVAETLLLATSAR